MSEIAEVSSPLNGPSCSPFPQNLNTPTGGILTDGVSPKTTFPMEISIESLIPYVPKGQKPLEAPTPPLSTPRYTMANGLNFGSITYPSQVPVFGRRIKVPRGLRVTDEPVEFAFVSEKQFKLPMSTSGTIFTLERAIKPLRESRVLSAKESEISSADASVSQEVVSGATQTGGLGDGDKVVEEHEGEVVGVSSEDVASSLSLALKTPLPDDDEHCSEDISLTLSLALNTPLPVDTEDSECPWSTPEIENKFSFGVDDNKALLAAPKDVVSARSAGSTISTKAIFIASKPIKPLRQPHSLLAKNPEVAFDNASVSPEIVFGGVVGGGLDVAEDFVEDLGYKVITPKTQIVSSGVSPEDITRTLSLALQTPLPDDGELCSKNVSLTLSGDTEPDHQDPLLAAETGAPVEADKYHKSILETPQDFVSAASPDSTVSIEILAPGVADQCSEDKHDMDSGNEPEEAKTAYRQNQPQAIQEPTSTAEATPIITESTPGLKAPLHDAEPCPEGVSPALSLAVNTPLPVDTEFDSELSLSAPEIEPPLEPHGGDKSRLKTRQSAIIAGSLDGTAPTEGIFIVGRPIKLLSQPHSPLSKEPEIAFVNASVSREAVFRGVGAGELGGGFEGAGEVIHELGDYIESARTPVITAEGGTNKSFSFQALSSDPSSEDPAGTFSLALETPLLNEDEPYSEDVSLALPHALNLNTPLPTGTGFGAHGENESPLEVPQDAVIAGSLDSPVSTEEISTAAKFMEPLCKGCALLAKKQEISSANTSVSWEVVSGGSGIGVRDGGDEPVDKLEDKATTFETQIASSDANSEDPARYLSITVKIPLRNGAKICSEDASLALSLVSNALSVNTGFGSEPHLPTPETESPVEADGEGKSPLEAPQDVAVARSADGTASIRVLAHRVPNGSLEDMLGADASHGEEWLGKESQHSQSQAVQEPNSTAEVISVITESTSHLKAPLLHDAEPCSEGALLALSLAANATPPIDTEFDCESLSDHKIKYPPQADSDNRLPVEASQDLLITGSPGSTVSTEAIFTSGVTITPLRQPRGLSAKKPEITFVNASVSREAIFGSVGAGGPSSVGQAIEGLEDEVSAFKTKIVSSGVGSEDLIRSLSLTLETPLLGDSELYSEDVSLTQSLAVNTPLPVDTVPGFECSLLIPETESPPGADEGSESVLDTRQDGGVAGPSGGTISTEAILAAEKPVKLLRQPHSPLPKEPEIALASASVSPETIYSRVSRPLSHALNTPLPIEAEFDFEHPLSNVEIKFLPEAEDGDKPLLEAVQDALIANPPDIAISMGESAIGILSRRLGDEEDQEPKNLDSRNKQHQLENRHLYNHPVPVEDPIPAPEPTTTAAGSTFDLHPAYKKTQASSPEAHGECEIPKSAATAPSAGAATLDLCPSVTAISGVSSSALSSYASTDTGTVEPTPTGVGFSETKFEFDMTNMFVGIFKEVGVADLALDTGFLAGTTGHSSRGPAAGKDEGAASSVDAGSEIVTTETGIEKGKKGSAAHKVFAGLGRVSVRKNVAKLFNKFSPAPVDIVE